MMDYIYLGDKMTDSSLIGKRCNAVRSPAGKCIRGKSGGMLVKFEDGQTCVVLARHLRRNDKYTSEQLSGMIAKRKRQV